MLLPLLPLLGLLVLAVCPGLEGACEESTHSEGSAHSQGSAHSEGSAHSGTAMAGERRCAEASSQPVLLVHGGAGDVSDDRVPRKIAGVKEAARKGFAVLAAGGSALDAVQAAVHVMEDDDAFNAGRGSVLNTDGEVEMDALFMEGKNMKAGAVGALRDVQHTIDVARLVMERTPHVLLVAEGAKRFANDNGVPDYPQEALVTDKAKLTLQKVLRDKDHTVHEVVSTDDKGVGTVGAVAMDATGLLASATSTGGMAGKMPGRVGDTPLVGCGGYADNNVGTISTTGHGESIIKSNLAYSIITKMKQGLSAKDAAEKALEEMTARVGNSAGAIVVSKDGEVGVSFNSKRMSWAYIKGKELHYGIEKGQDEVEPLQCH